MKDMVKISNLNQTFYTKDGELEVLKNINFNLMEGQILTILGPSGSGKSTILNILTKLLKPTSGDVIINGKIGYMFQKDNLLEWRNIMDNITIGLEIQKKKTDEAMKRVERLLKTYDLWEFRNMYPKELSGGMKQRCAIAQAFSIDPPILLMDEPFGALDAVTRARLQDLVRELWTRDEKKKTVFFVTHDVDEALLLGKRLVVMQGNPGRIVSDYKNPLNKYENIDYEQLRQTKEYWKIRQKLIGQIQNDEEKKAEKLIQFG